jgi:hypothetical protein
MEIVFVRFFAWGGVYENLARITIHIDSDLIVKLNLDRQILFRIAILSRLLMAWACIFEK